VLDHLRLVLDLYNHALNAREADRACFIVAANQLRNLTFKAIRDLFDRSNVAGVGLLQQLARNAARRFVIIASCQHFHSERVAEGFVGVL
jgi:hypothetical protein